MVGRLEVDKYNLKEVREIVKMLKKDGYIVAVEDTEDGGVVIHYVGR